MDEEYEGEDEEEEENWHDSVLHCSEVGEVQRGTECNGYSRIAIITF